jgi:hypothetical protein
MIFINYRIDDTNDLAHWLDRSLTQEFGRAMVFHDKTRLDGGQDFTDDLSKNAKSRKIMLAVIGTRWDSVSFKEGPLKGFPRLFDPEDWVRREISISLAAGNIVIPVLATDAVMPLKKWLNKVGLARLASLQAVKFRTDEYENDFPKLVKLLREYCPTLPLKPEAGDGSLRKSVPSIIRVVNCTGGLISNEDLDLAVRTVNRQLTEDFAPNWGTNAQLLVDLGDGRGDLPSRTKTRSQTLDTPKFGDGVVYIYTKVSASTVLAYHRRQEVDVPLSLVCTECSRALHESWTVTLSRAVLEMIVDPYGSRLTMGPSPVDSKSLVFHSQRICDPVHAQSYEIDGVNVSNFVLHTYYAVAAKPLARHDHLGRLWGGNRLQPFGVTPGAFIHYFDPAKSVFQAYSLRGDVIADKRLRTLTRWDRLTRSHKLPLKIRQSIK